jgi:hypothetical protein
MKRALFVTLATIVLFCIFPLALTAGPRDTEAPPAKAGDNAPPKPDAGKPTDEANGLKIELKVLNAPLYPGDELQLEVRLTDTQKEGDIQIIDYPMIWVAFHPVAIGPDGQQIIWPEPKMPVKLPDAPAATLKPGGFYGRKIALDASKMQKPGKYAISYRYSNGQDLKDKGFNCWTGNLQSKTVMFDVADVDAKADANGMKMFIKMKPQYKENEPIAIMVYLYNSGDNEKEVRPLSEHLLWLSNGQLKDAKGVVPQSNNPDFVDTPRANVKLASHQAIINEYDLRTAYHKLPVGKYAYQLHSTNPGMISNEVSFEILPAEKPKAPEAPIKDGLQMSIRMAKDKYAEKEPVTFTVSLKNVSDKEKEVYVFDEMFLGCWSAGVVRNAEGKAMDWKIQIIGARPAFKKDKLPPGKAFTKEYDLRDGCDLPVGKYTFHLKGGVPDLGEMLSNEVSFEILPAEKPKDPAKPGEAPVKDGVQMLVTMSKEKYAADEKVEFTIHMKNVSKEEKSVYMPNGEHFVNRPNPGHITKTDGTEVQWKIKYERHIVKPNFKTLKPGEENAYTYDLRTMADLPAGEYTLQLVAENAEFGKYESNKVKFTVEKP